MMIEAICGLQTGFKVSYGYLVKCELRKAVVV